MPEPKKRQTKGSQGSRRSHIKIKLKTPSSCQNCGKSTLSHRACIFCGHYRGREVTNVLARESKRQEKAKQRS